jgi:ribA/ribD-fused uncharacterized protein
MVQITAFRDEYRFLSNFWPCKFRFRGYEWNSAEHAYQAMKCQDIEYQMAFLYPRVSAAEAKRMGASAKMDDSFASNKLNYMRAIVSAKFDQNPELMTLLKSTAPAELVEGNTWGDTFWGVYNGKGHNHLGKILMNIRDDITRLL